MSALAPLQAEIIGLLHNEQSKAHAKVAALAQQIEALNADISNRAEKMSRLEELTVAQAGRLADAQSLLSEKDSLEDAVKKQAELIERQAAELKLAKSQLDDKSAALEKARAQVEELTLQCASSTRLEVAFGGVWLLRTTRLRLRGDVPLDREGATLSAMPGSRLLMHGGAARSHEDGAKSSAVLDLETATWHRPVNAQDVRRGAPPSGHSATPMDRGRVLVFGGVRGDQATAELASLTPETRWEELAPLHGAAAPQPRSGHAAAAVGGRLFVFGGVSRQGELLNDLWVLNSGAPSWVPVVGKGHSPTPRRGASLSATEDGRRLYLFGGHDSVALLSDLWYYEPERATWAAANPSGSAPEPREGHAAAVVGRYLLVCGGCGAGGSSSNSGSGGSGAGGGARALCDTHALDMFTGPRWERLDDGSWGSNALWLKPVMEITLPEDIERMQAAHAMERAQFDRFEVLDSAVCTSNSIELTWRPPSKNAERIASYKLMLAAGAGVVRPVYQGSETTHRVAGLKPNAEYVFCIKAAYDDGSHMWSESKAFRTQIS